MTTCLTRAVLLAATLALSSAAFAHDVAQVVQLMRAKDYATAEARADAYIVRLPNDPRMRFLKGTMLAAQKKVAPAATVFSRLTEDFPELPEPHNNLAVQYAAMGLLDPARVELETAIRLKPDYAVAYENLGDLHAYAASLAYDKAIQAGAANERSVSKQTSMRVFLREASMQIAGMRELKPTPTLDNATAAPASPSNEPQSTDRR